MIRDMTNFADLTIGVDDDDGNDVNEEEQEGEEEEEEDNDNDVNEEEQEEDDYDRNGADIKCCRACDRNVLGLLLFPGGETTS